MAVRQTDPDRPDMLEASGRAVAEDNGGIMSQDQLDALIARLASDPTFAASLAAATTVEDAQQIAAKHGFDVTSAELTSVASDGNLTDADLEAVAGGGLVNTKGRMHWAC